MPRRRQPVTAPRKLPTQARSTQLVADVLKAAVRVLEREGPDRFTTIRVAEAAGVSVGSVYQYFPNKQAILFRLQLDEWKQTGEAINAILGDVAAPPAKRLRTMMRAFFRSECDEAPLRRALDAAVMNYKDNPEARGSRRRDLRIVNAFVAAAAPRATPRQLRFAAEVIFMTMSAVGKQVSERPEARAEIDRWADAIAEMLNVYLARLAPPKRSEARERGKVTKEGSRGGSAP